jgi:glyoxylase-like metal-dependent hydrolase (beta-lactamase superfamily II)
MMWQIGEATVTAVKEIEVPLPAAALIPDAVPENLAPHPWLWPHYVDDTGKLRVMIQALLVRSGGRRIVVDTCVGNDKERTFSAFDHLATGLLDELAAVDFARDRVDTVVCTHLHVDHVGWNTILQDGKWVPTFPNARYLVAREEWEYWREHDDREYGDVLGDSVAPIFDAGLVDLIEPDHRITDEVCLESTAGHTPGHLSVRISSAGAEAVITGDLMHHPSQCAHPEWASSADVDPQAARATRRAFLERHADSPVLVIGTHFASRSAGHVHRDGAAFRFDPEP